MAVATALLALSVPTQASAADHQSFRELFTDPNFCGSGVAVSGVFESHDTSSEQAGVTKVVHQGSVTYTRGDESVTLSFAGQFTFETVEGDLSGIHVNLLTSKGLSSKLQLAGGRVLLLDAGLVEELVTLTPADETIGDVIVTMHGPHPIATSFGAVFCDVVPGALGI